MDSKISQSRRPAVEQARTKAQILQLIEKAVERKGGTRSVADALKLTTQAIYHYLHGNRPPTDKFLKYIGLERVIVYRPIRAK